MEKNRRDRPGDLGQHERSPRVKRDRRPIGYILRLMTAGYKVSTISYSSVDAIHGAIMRLNRPYSGTPRGACCKKKMTAVTTEKGLCDSNLSIFEYCTLVTFFTVASSLNFLGALCTTDVANSRCCGPLQSFVRDGNNMLPAISRFFYNGVYCWVVNGVINSIRLVNFHPCG